MKSRTLMKKYINSLLACLVIMLTTAGTAYADFYTFSGGSGGTTVTSVTNSDGTINATPTTGAVVVSIPASAVLPNGVTGTTQAAGDATAKLATDSFVTTAVNNAISGVNPAIAVTAATTGVLPNSPTYSNGVAGVGATLTAGSNTTLTVDGVTFAAVTQSVLVKNQASAFQNGIYNVTQVGSGILPWILTRRLDYDQPSDINNTGAIPVTSGTANTTTSWVQTAQITTVGTDSLVFAQFTLNPATVQSNTLTNTHVLVGNSSNVATDVAVSGDAIMASTGALTVTKTNGSAFAASATTDTTVATNISSGTLPAARLPASTADATGQTTTGLTPQISGSGTYSWVPGVLSSHITLSSSQILNLFTTPVQVVAAPADGRTLVPLMIISKYNYNTTTYAGGGLVRITYGSVAGGAGFTAIPTSTITSVASVPYANQTPSSGGAGGPGANLGLFVTNATAAFTTGNGTADLWVFYVEI